MEDQQSPVKAVARIKTATQVILVNHNQDTNEVQIVTITNNGMFTYTREADYSIDVFGKIASAWLNYVSTHGVVTRK